MHVWLDTILYIYVRCLTQLRAREVGGRAEERARRRKKHESSSDTNTPNDLISVVETQE
jgi:hypothetical protein